MKCQTLIYFKLRQFILCSYLLATTIKGDVTCNQYLDGTTGGGIVESPNYPFNYKNNQNCIQRISIDSKDFIPGTKKVCLKFQRFRLDDTRQDFVTFNDIPYNGNGTYSYLFIWEGICETLSDDNWAEVQIITDPQFVNTGYRAEFEILPIEEDAQGGYACKNNEWRCLDGTCISQEKVCDNHKDCSDFEDESYAHARCTIGQISGMVACDFAEGNDATCNTWSTWRTGWKQETGTTHDIYGPSEDHTGGDIIGSYVRTHFQWNALKSFVYVVEIGSALDSSSPYCLSFWYHMRADEADAIPDTIAPCYLAVSDREGKDPGILGVYWGITGQNGIPPWSRKGNHGDKWHRGQLERMNFDINKNPLFEVMRGGEIDSQIALDDISILKGHCYNMEDISCNFEGTLCNWDIILGNWLLESADETGSENPPHDSSSGRSEGQYLKIYGQFGKIRSPTVTSSNSPACLSYYVCASGGWSKYGQIQVKQIGITNNIAMTARKSINQTDGWVQHTLDIPQQSLPYQIEINVILTYHSTLSRETPQLLIDEISLVFDGCQSLDLKTCSPSEFRCDDKKLDKCIPSYLKCDGNQDCEDSSDERNCPELGRCASNEFQCTNGMCILVSNVCNGVDDCGDNSDEYKCPGKPAFMGSYTIAAVASIIAAAVILIIIIFVKVIMCYYRRRPRRPDTFSAGMFKRRESHDSAQPPPTYDQCADNLTTYPKPEHDGRRESERDLPSYDLVQTEQYVQITVPIEDEVRRMREAMATRSNDIDISSNALVDPPVPPITGAPALFDGGYLKPPVPLVAWEPAVHHSPGRSYRRTGHVNRAYSGSDMSTVSSGEDEMRSENVDIFLNEDRSTA